MNQVITKMPFNTHAVPRAMTMAFSAIFGDVLFNSGGLAIGTTKTQVKFANTIYFMINSVMCKATTAAVSMLGGGNTTNAKYKLYAVCITAAGVLSVVGGTEGASLALLDYPVILNDVVVLGYVLIHPTGTGNFVGGTTDLDDGTVVPNAVYIDAPNPVAGFARLLAI